MNQDSKKYHDLQEVKNAVINFCNYQDRTHREVKEKLESYGLIPLAVDTIMLDLIEKGIVNELRYAENYSRGKHRIKGWGRIKIKHHLKQKGISEPCINLGLQAIDDEEYLENLKRLVLWKFEKTNEKKIYQKKYKTVNYILTKGYEYDLVREAVDQCLEGRDF